MKFFLDTANLDEIKEACSWGVVAGVTTNPTLVSKEGNIDFHTRVREIAEVVNGPVSALGAVKELTALGIKTNVTLVFSANQAILAAAAGATYVSPFVGRLDDIGEDGLKLVYDVVDIYDAYGIETKVIAASLRHPAHVLECAKAGADYATVPFKVLKMLFNHPLTTKGIDQFNADWAKYMEAKK